MSMIPFDLDLSAAYKNRQNPEAPGWCAFTEEFSLFDLPNIDFSETAEQIAKRNKEYKDRERGANLILMALDIRRRIERKKLYDPDPELDFASLPIPDEIPVVPEPYDQLFTSDDFNYITPYYIKNAIYHAEHKTNT